MKKQNVFRKLIPGAFLLGALIVIMACALTVSASVETTTTRACKLRSGPSSSYAKIIDVPKGAHVTAGVTQGKYTKVIYKTGGKTYGGYIYSKYLASYTPGTTKTVYTDVWLRSGPGTQYAKIGIVRKGTSVSVLSGVGNWYLVNYQGTTGYMKQGYFTDETITRTVKTAVFMRSTPSAASRSNIIRTIPAGGAVTVYRITGSWCYASYNGTYGYVHVNYFN